MENIFYYKSPIGIFEITVENGKINHIKIVKEEKETSNTLDENVKTQLDEYFAGKRKSFDLEINLIGTEFQKKVWKELQKIPYGKTKSYQEIAEAIGNPNAQRAVGSACNKNSILLIIPCHRVIAKSGALTGFEYGLKAKEYLLKLEKSL